MVQNGARVEKLRKKMKSFVDPPQNYENPEKRCIMCYITYENPEKWCIMCHITWYFSIYGLKFKVLIDIYLFHNLNCFYVFMKQKVHIKCFTLWTRYMWHKHMVKQIYVNKYLIIALDRKTYVKQYLKI